MAWPWKPTEFGPHGRTIQWLNSCFSSHATFCGCDSAYLHFLSACNNNSYTNLTEQEILSAKQCLTSTTTGTEETGIIKDEKDGIDALGDGDLQKLFEEPFEEEDQDSG